MTVDPVKDRETIPGRKSQIQVLINDRLHPVNIEPYSIPKVRWRLHLGEDDLADICAARIRVADTIEDLRLAESRSEQGRLSGLRWDSGIRPIEKLRGIELAELPMGPSLRYWLLVDLIDDRGRVKLQSAPVTFGTGPGRLWRVKTIWAPRARNQQKDQGNSGGWALMRGGVRLPHKGIRWATLNATASSTRPSRQFVYRLWLNGRFLGCGPVFPLADEARYDGYDVSSILQPGGDNFLGVIAYTTQDQRFAAQLDVCFEDGQVMHYGTDPGWKAVSGDDVFPDSSSIGTQYYQAPAENISLSRYPVNLSVGDFDDSSWPPAQVKEPFHLCLADPADSLELTYISPKQGRQVGPGHVLLDFGSVFIGGVRLSMDLKSPMNLSIRYGEVLDDSGHVKYHLSTTNVYEDHWQLKRGKNVAETWGIRVFRYVEFVWGGRDKNQISSLEELMKHVEGACLLAPVTDTHANFQSSQNILNQVWRLGRDTIHGLNANIYVDSWTRERAPYEADAWIQQRAHLALDDAPALGRYTINYLIRNRTWPTEWPLYSILAVHDAWMITGDLSQADRQYQRLCGLLPTQYLDRESGLIVKDPGESSQMDGDLVDWPPGERDGYIFGRVNTVINALASKAFADMGRLARALGHHGDALLFIQTAMKMRQSINTFLYDPGMGAYRDGLKDGPQGRVINHHSLHASAFALAFALPDNDQIPRVGDFLRSRGMSCSVYVAAVYLDGLYRSGLGADATSLLLAQTGIRNWKHMLDQGAGGTMEAWDPSLKANTTYSHPWAASPTYLLPTGLMGLRPLQPGYSTLACIPQPGSLDQAEVLMPLPIGDIWVRYQIRGQVRVCRGSASLPDMKLELNIPPGCCVTVVLPPMSGVGPGESLSVWVDGVPRVVRSASRSFCLAGTRCLPGSLRVGEVGFGHHLISYGYQGA